MRKYIDLTHTIQEGMITAPAPWHPPVEISQLGRHCLEGRESYKLVLGSHKGSYEKITPEDLINSGVQIEKGDRIIIRTGWYKHWGTQKFFREYPCFTPEAAQYLVDKGIRLISMDMPSPDNPLDKLEPGQPNPMHYAFLSKGIFINEYLTNLDEIPVDEFEFVMLPLKVKGMDGFPVRAVAIIEE